MVSSLSARSRRGCVLYLSAPLAAVLAAPAMAQTQLPGVVVTTPSPVKPPTAAARAGTLDRAAIGRARGPRHRRHIAADFARSDASWRSRCCRREQLLSQPSSTLGDALATRPGIAATTFAPGASRPVIRGLSGFRVRIQENGLSTGDVSALSDDHAIPIDPLAAGQVEVVRGPATLRYGSQAIGGVVNAVNNRIPEVIPPNGIVVETRGGLSTVDDGRNGAAIVEAGSGNFVIHADTFARSANDYRIPRSPGRQANTSLDSDGYSLGGSFVFKDGFVGVAYSSFDSTYFIPGIEAAERKNHIVLDQTKWTSKGEWRVNDIGHRGHPLLVRRHRLQARRGGFAAGARSSARRFCRSSTKRAWRSQHQPVMTALGVLRGAAGVQWSNRDLQGARRRRHPAGADQHQQPRRLSLRGTAADQEAALSGRRPHRERRRQGHGLDLSRRVPAAARRARPRRRPSASSCPRASAPASSTICRTASSRA